MPNQKKQSKEKFQQTQQPLMDRLNHQPLNAIASTSKKMDKLFYPYIAKTLPQIEKKKTQTIEQYKKRLKLKSKQISDPYEKLIRFRKMCHNPCKIMIPQSQKVADLLYPIRPLRTSQKKQIMSRSEGMNLAQLLQIMRQGQRQSNKRIPRHLQYFQSSSEQNKIHQYLFSTTNQERHILNDPELDFESKTDLLHLRSIIQNELCVSDCEHTNDKQWITEDRFLSIIESLQQPLGRGILGLSDAKIEIILKNLIFLLFEHPQ
jgi:hypothetical protein